MKKVFCVSLIALMLVCLVCASALAQTTGIAMDGKVYTFTGGEGTYQADGKTFIIGVESVVVQEPGLPDRVLELHQTEGTEIMRDGHPAAAGQETDDSIIIREDTAAYEAAEAIAVYEQYSYDEFSAWLETETENIQKLVDAGEWTEAEAAEALACYDEILKSILEGKMVGKRASSSDDQLFFSMPDNAQPEQYQTFVFDGNTYKSIGPFDTEEELFNALKDYTDAEVEAGTMTQTEATALLEKYQ